MTNETTLSASSVAAHVAPMERTHFSALLLANPNYFGNLKNSVYPPIKAFSGNTTYEELKCVGYHPDLNVLKAVVVVKQNSGYGGGLCSAGTQEYVRFFLSFDNGATWEDQGYASFNTHDLTGPKPLDYAVTVKPEVGSTWCSKESLPLVRAILSWNVVPPSDPNFVPVWGNILNAHIQIHPQPLYVLGDLFTEAKLKLSKDLVAALDLSAQIPAAIPKKPTPGELLKDYANKGVQVHRLLYPEIHQNISNPAILSAQAAYGSKGSLAELDIDIAALIAAINKTQGDTGYEQLDCVGLDPNGTANLVATLTIKRPYGYLGSQCQTGSTEYVAFFIDWLNGGGWEWAGTTQVKVHDFTTIPADGLRYAVAQPIDLSKHLKSCKSGPVIANVRAILSWNAMPPSWNPNYVPTWGNHLDGRIEIEPGAGTHIGDYTPYLEGVCGVASCDVDPATGFAPGERPFGGSVSIYGFIPGAPKMGPTTQYPATSGLPRYRVSVRQLPGGSKQYLNDSFGVTLEQQIGAALPTSQSVTQSVDADNYYPYLNVTPDAAAGWQEMFPSHLLAVWNTAGKTGKWEIQVEAYDPVGNVQYPAGSLACLGLGTTMTNLVIDLDNAAPLTSLSITGFSRNGGPVQPAADCGSFQVGDVIYGDYSVSDEHFGSLSLDIEPAAAANGAKVKLSVDGFVTLSTTSRSYPTVPTTGESGQWRLDTAGMDPCGYTVQLLSNDRTIVNCTSPWENNTAFVGFCLVAVPAPVG